jgi:nucleoside-diphosphate-sugar epimerase
LTFLSGVAALLDQQALAGRILGFSQVNISKNRQLLGWTHPVPLDQALGLTAQHFLGSRKS